MRFQLIDDQRGGFAITRMCGVLDVSASGYYAWRTRPVSAREMANRQLVEKIKSVHTANYEVYGSPRIYRELQAQGETCSRNRVARLMRLYHIQAKQVRRYKTTDGHFRPGQSSGADKERCHMRTVWWCVNAATPEQWGHELPG